MIHNFICAHDPTDIPNDTEMEMVSVLNEETARVDSMAAKLADRAVGNEEQKQAAGCRELIALAMWDDY
jgi:hypothetical protein